MTPRQQNGTLGVGTDVVDVDFQNRRPSPSSVGNAITSERGRSKEVVRNTPRRFPPSLQKATTVRSFSLL